LQHQLFKKISTIHPELLPLKLFLSLIPAENQARYSMQQRTSNKLKRTSTWVFRVILFQLILINISAAFHAHRLTHYYDGEKVRNQPSSSGTIFLRTWRLMTGRKMARPQIAWYPPMPYDTVQLSTASGVKIEGWYIKADSSKGTVILFHGLSSNKGNILSEAAEFLSLGYHTLLIDMRAHGNSGGSVSSLGIKESEEVKLGFEYIKNKGEKNIILWGMSLGAAIIAKAIHDYPIQPSKVILEAPFANLQSHIRARARVAGFPDEPFGFFVTFWTGAEQGYWGFSHRVTNYVKKINCPVLLQWGAKDTYVLRRETDSIFLKIASEKKQLVIYNEAGHEHLIGRDGEKWQTSIKNFLAG
jgi:hypothetical protein